MDHNKLEKVCENIAQSTETGYSSLYTFSVRELLTQEERGEFANFLRNAAKSYKPDQKY